MHDREYAEPRANPSTVSQARPVPWECWNLRMYMSTTHTLTAGTHVSMKRNYLIEALCFPLSVVWAVEAKSILTIIEFPSNLDRTRRRGTSDIHINKLNTLECYALQ